MTYTVKEIKVKSTDGIHTLSGIMYVPDGEALGILHIVHGMTEYIGRYDHIMSAAAKFGFIACGYDNLGHGKTVNSKDELGFIAHKDGWKYLVDDVNKFELEVQKMYPDKKLFLLGHSMGSFISRLAAEKYGNSYSKVIFCGTGGPQKAADLGLMLTSLLKKTHGEKYISNAVDKIAFGAYNKKFEHISKYDWITKDRNVIDAYSKDEYCTFKFTVSAMHDLVKLSKTANRGMWFENMRKDLPILLIAGDSDPVGSYGKGVTKVYNGLKRHGCQVKIKLYENCRHEILNDTCRNEVISDILAFITE